MAVQMDFSFTRGQDGVIHVSMSPPIPIGGLDLQWEVSKRFGGTALITKRATSGFGGGTSGITVTNSGQGTFDVAINGPDTSGWDAGNYAHRVSITTSGRQTPVAEGYVLFSV